MFDLYQSNETDLFRQKHVRRRLKSGKKPAKEVPQWDATGPTSIYPMPSRPTTSKKTSQKPNLSLNNPRLNDRMNSRVGYAGRRNILSTQ